MDAEDNVLDQISAAEESINSIEMDTTMFDEQVIG
jgi:hypothetical protein